MPSELAVNQRQENMMDMVNPYNMWFDSAFWKWQAMRLAPLGARMLPGLANEQKWAQMIRAPIGTRSLIYPWITESRKSYFRDMNRKIGDVGSSAERIALRNEMYEHILSKDIIDEHTLTTKGKGIKSLNVGKMGKGGLIPGFFVGQVIGGALGLDVGGQVAAGIGGAIAVKSTGGLAPLLYKAGAKGPARWLAQLAFGAEVDTGRQAFDFLFGARSGYGDLVKDLNRTVHGQLQTKIDQITERFKTINIDERIRRYPKATFAVPKGFPGVRADIMSEKPIISSISISKEMPYDRFTSFTSKEGKSIINNAVRDAVFNRGFFKDVFVTENSMRKRMEKSIAAELKGKVLQYAKADNLEAIQKLAPGWKGLGAVATDKMRSKALEEWALSEASTPYFKQMATETMKTTGGEVALKQGTKMARRVGRVALGGIAIGMTTTGVLAAQAVMATYKYAVQGANVLASTIRSMSYYDFGKGFAVETPQATSERAMAMQSIQNALGMGRSLLGGEAAFMH